MGRGAAANGTESTALGRGSVATGNQSIALGKGANAKVDSGVALGDDSVADRTARSQNGIVINTSNPSKSTGFNTENSVYAPVRLVDDPEALNLIKNTIKGNKGAVSVGDSGNTRQIINVAAGSADSDAVNVAQLKAVVGTIKHYNVTSKDGDITIDPDTTDPNKTVWDLKINPKYKIKYFSVKSEGGANQNNDGATATDAIAIGKNASSTGSSAVSLGLGAKALGANNTAIGAGAQAKDVRTTAIGYNATAEAASAVGIGYEAHATKSRSVAIGQDATASANNAIALGSSGQQLGNDRPNKTTASAEYAVAIGSGAVANITNGIALGSQSKTTQDKGQVGFDASQDVEGARTNKYDNLKNNVQNVRTSTLAGLSIGDTGKTRQINHLAAGTADDDAVNVAQLKSVNLAFKGDNNTKGDVRLHDQRLSVVGAQNSFITTKASDNKLEIGTKTGTIAVTEATGAVTPITTATGLVTDKTVADAIAKSGFQLKENGTLKNVVNPGESLNFKPGQGTTVSVGANGDVQVNANVTDITAGNNIQVNKGDDGKYTISATDTNTQASVSKAANSPITINPTGADNAKNYELDVAVDGTTIVKEGGKLKANLPDVSTTDLTLNEGKVTTPSTDNGKKLVNATTVANAINSAYWKATRGESNDSNDDKADNATSNVKAGDELTFVAGKNMALKKAGNTFTYGTKNDVSFTTVTSNGVTVNGGGSLTVGAGSTINMGNNVVSGVATGVADTDAVNVAQLKANTSVVSAGDNITVTPSTNAEGNKVYTVAAKNTQATVSKADGDNPITLDNSTTNANGTTNYKVGLDIDESTLEVKNGKLAAKAQAKAIEVVERKEDNDNIAQVDVKSGKAKGDAGATYQVSVTKNDVKDVAKEAVDVRGSDFITVTPTDGTHLKTHTVAAKTGEITVTEATGAVTPITTATGLVTDKTVADAIAKSGFQLKENGTLKNVVNPGESLNFKPGQGTTVSVGANGDVQVNANVTDITAGNNIQVNKGDDGKYTISATDTNTQASVSKAANSPITINPTGADNAKNYELDVAVDGTTIVKEGGKLKANLPDVSTTDLTLNEGKVTTPSTDNGKKLVNATTVANAINSAYWKATRGESNDSNDDKADNATSNVKAGDELTFVAGKNMALKKAGNTFTYGTKNDVSFTTVTSNGVTVNGGGSLTVGAGSTINMGNNVVSGVATGVADTDAVNVAQLKANAATVVAGKNVSVDVAENASTGKTFTVHSEKTTVSGTGPVTVKATSDAANHTTNYNVEFDSSKAAEQTDLTYKANGKDAKKVKLSEGLDFTNGKGTKASVGENGKVTIDANVTDIAAGNNIQVNKGDDGKYTISSTNTITTVKGKDGSAAKVTTATGSTDTNKIYEVDVNVDGKTIVNENGTLQAKGWKTKVVKGEGEVEGSSEETVNGSDTVNYIAGKNVKLVQNGKNFTIATKDNVTFKDTTTTNLSVTTGGKVDMGNNKVTNVAEGTENTDAVNVKQLKDFKSEVAEGGLTFAGNSGTAHKAKLNTTVNIKGGEGNTDADQFDKGKNVITAVNGNTVTVSIKKTPEVEGINIIDTTGKVKVKLTQTAEGLKVSDGNNNATRITNVKAGEKDTDAVNVKQLNAAKTEVTAGDNIDVRSSTGANGQTIYKVSANDTSAAVKGGSDHVKVTKAANTHKDGSTTVTDYTIDLSNKTKEDIKKGVDAHTEVTTKGLTFNADTGTTGVKKLGSKVAVNGDGKNITTTADENGVKVSMKDDIKVNSVTAKEVKVGDVNINENGINAGGKRITNVAPGKDGTDAVNVNQLKYVAGNISNQINNVDKGLRAGIAGALASGGLYHVTTPGKSMVSVGAGAYRGQNALAVGYSRLSDNGKVGVKFTVNSNSQGHSGASASVGYQW